jgi:MFS family permease
MPRLSCWFIHAALIHLAIGSLVGGLLLGAKGLPEHLVWAWLLLPAHIQLLIGGWLIQLALGVAYWVFPRLQGAGERGRPRSAWISFGSLNGGVSGTAILLTLRPFWTAVWLDALLALTALLQALALATFAWHAWPRVAPAPRPAGSRRHPDALLRRP